MSLNVSRPVQTRGGKPARIICTNRVGNPGYESRSIVALVADSTVDQAENAIIYYTSGRYSVLEETSLDLVNITEHEYRWACRGTTTIDFVTPNFYTREEAAAMFGNVAIGPIENTKRIRQS